MQIRVSRDCVLNLVGLRGLKFELLRTHIQNQRATNCNSFHKTSLTCGYCCQVGVVNHFRTHELDAAESCKVRNCLLEIAVLNR